MMTEQQLLDLKEDVETAKQKVSELTGQQIALLSQLKNDWGCKIIAEAETKLKEMDDSISSIDKKIEKGVKDLESKYSI